MLPLKDSQPAKIFAFWTIAIIVLNIYTFYQMWFAGDPEVFIQRYALIPALIDFSNWSSLIPFITSQFLHGGLLHIASNMLFLWIFGDNVEEHFGFLVFPIFYLLSGVIGGLSQYFFLPESTIPMIGASGAVAGVLGAYFALFPNHKVKTLVPIFLFITVMDIPAWAMLLYWIVTQIYAGAASISPTSGNDIGGIAYFAHIGGFIFGWVFAKMFPKESVALVE